VSFLSLELELTSLLLRSSSDPSSLSSFFSLRWSSFYGLKSIRFLELNLHQHLLSVRRVSFSFTFSSKTPDSTFLLPSSFFAFSAPSRVFQVLMASPEHEVLLSHPPPRDPSADRSITPCDGGYWEEEFQKLLLEISLNPQGGSQFAEAKTTCTRRFRAKHTLLTEGCYRVIESVFIPYGESRFSSLLFLLVFSPSRSSILNLSKFFVTLS